jgi:hypothetical protein
MTNYIITNKTTHEIAYRFQADILIEFSEFPFSQFDYTIETVEPPYIPELHPTDHLIDIGPFFDRFGSAKVAILTSTDPVVKAIIQDVAIRKWVDLTRPDVISSINYIASKVPSVTATIISDVLRTPVTEEENLALRKTYFNNGILNG